MTVAHGAINNRYDQAVMACDILSDWKTIKLLSMDVFYHGNPMKIKPTHLVYNQRSWIAHSSSDIKLDEDFEGKVIQLDQSLQYSSKAPVIVPWKLGDLGRTQKLPETGYVRESWTFVH